jgi:hypothetical protein
VRPGLDLAVWAGVLGCFLAALPGCPSGNPSDVGDGGAAGTVGSAGDAGAIVTDGPPDAAVTDGGGLGADGAFDGNGVDTGVLDPHAAVLAAIRAEIQRVMAEPPEQVDADLIAFLRGRPELTDVSSAPGAIAASFTDGPWLLLSRDVVVEPSAGSSPDGGAALAEPVSPSPRYVPARSSLYQSAGDTATVEFPGKNTATLFNAIADFEVSGVSTDDLAALLRLRGWQVTQSDASLDALRGLTGIGFFFINTHGSSVPVCATSSCTAKRPTYALRTSTPAHPETDPMDPRLNADLASGRVGYGLSLSTVPGLRDLDYYWIAPDFVTKEWSFANPAIAYVGSCNSAAPDATALSDAMAAKGIAVYLGWSNFTSFKNIRDSAAYLVDRMLGANTVRPESPRQRPFDSTSVLNDMHAKALLPANAMDAHGTVFVADLVAVGSPVSMVLAPSILGMRQDVMNSGLWAGGADPHDRFIVGGLFGARPGTVSVNGSAVSVVNWSADEVDIVLPNPGEPGSSGDVVVSVDAVESNAVPLTAWHPHYHYELRDDICFGTSTCDQHSTLDLDLWLRADVHDRRWNIAEPPSLPSDLPPSACNPGLLNCGVGVGPAPTSSLSFDISGTLTYETSIPSTMTMCTFADQGQLPYSSGSSGSDGWDLATPWRLFDPNAATGPCAFNGGPWLLYSGTMTCSGDGSGVFPVLGGEDLNICPNLSPTDMSLVGGQSNAALTRYVQTWDTVAPLAPPDGSKGEDDQHDPPP